MNTLKNAFLLYREDGFTKIPQGPEVRYIFIPSNRRDYVMMRAAIEGRTVTTGEDAGESPPPTYFGHKPTEYFKMLHPDLISYVTENFLKSTLLTGTYSNLCTASTGGLMLMTALHTCDQVSGYGSITENFDDFSEHYCDAVKKPLKFYANHDMEMESLVWEALDQVKAIWLYKRTPRS